MFIARLIMSLALGVLVSACGSGAVEPNRIIVQAPTLVVAFNDASAQGQFTGTVIGHPLVGDSNAVGGATIIVYTITVASNTPGATAQRPDSIATMTAGADGRFELIRIPTGLYAFRVIPPISSPYAETDLWEFVSDGKSRVVGHVGVYP